MPTKHNAAILGLLVMVLFIGFVWVQSSIGEKVVTLPEATQDASEIVSDTTGTAPEGKTYSMMEVATHNTESSCWSAIDNTIYDLTKWIPQHPGGRNAILGLCGKDGTNAFHGQHGDAKRQADVLKKMKIATLSK